jgi:hypothetical protein
MMTDERATATREQRLAAQLRENLKRRKAQARAQRQVAGEDDGEAGEGQDGAAS